MNLLELRTETQRILAEKSSTAAYQTPTDINKFINEGIKDICIKGLVYQRTKTLPVISSVASYTLPLDFIKVITLNNQNGVSLEPMSPDLTGRIYIVAGKPLWYYISQTSITTYVRADLTVYSAETFLTPSTANGFMYEVVTSGITGAAAPTYPTNPGSSVADGTATLTCRELANKIYAFTLVDTPTTIGGGDGTYTLIYFAIDEGLYIDTDMPNFPWEKHHLLVSYAAMKSAEKQKDYDLMKVFAMEYAAGLGLKLQEGSQEKE